VVSDEQKHLRQRENAAIDLVHALEEQWLNELRQGRPVDDIVDEIRRRFRAADIEERRWFAGALVTFLIRAERESETLQVVDEMIDELPDDVLFPMRKASLYLYTLDDAESALPCIDLALQRARRSGLFRRQALGKKARILLELRRGEELSQVLEEIMSIQIVEGIADIGRERDFVDRAPPGLISEDVLARYNQFRPKRPGDGMDDMPPEWEPPEWA
jgi:hypothetical protein